MFIAVNQSWAHPLIQDPAPLPSAGSSFFKKIPNSVVSVIPMTALGVGLMRFDKKE